MSLSHAGRSMIGKLTHSIRIVVRRLCQYSIVEAKRPPISGNFTMGTCTKATKPRRYVRHRHSRKVYAQADCLIPVSSSGGPKTYRGGLVSSNVGRKDGLRVQARRREHDPISHELGFPAGMEEVVRCSIVHTVNHMGSGLTRRESPDDVTGYICVTTSPVSPGRM